MSHMMSFDEDEERLHSAMPSLAPPPLRSQRYIERYHHASLRPPLSKTLYAEWQCRLLCVYFDTL